MDGMHSYNDIYGYILFIRSKILTKAVHIRYCIHMIMLLEQII